MATCEHPVLSLPLGVLLMLPATPNTLPELHFLLLLSSEPADGHVPLDNNPSEFLCICF